MSQTDSGAPRCARHPKVETYLRCASCNTPICPNCFVESPVGYKCRDCGKMLNSALFKLTFAQGVAAMAVGLLGGALAGWLLGFVGFWGIWIALIYGRFLGNLITRAAGHKMGLVMDIITGASIVLGGLAVRLGVAFYHLKAIPFYKLALTHAHISSWMLVLDMLHPFALISVAVVAGAAISRMRFDWNVWRL